MAGIYYFLPKITPDELHPGGLLNRDLLAAAGLETVLFDVTKVPQHAVSVHVSRACGPWQGTGTMLSLVSRHTGTPSLVVPDFNRQLWKPVGDGSQCWLGCLKDEPPTPHDLERWEQLPGALITDRHTREWRVPVARLPDPTFQFGHLPQSYVFDAAGEPVGRVQPAYEWLWVLAGEVRGWYLKDAAPEEDATAEEKADHERQPFSWLTKQAARVLGVNYRLALPELNLLHDVGRDVLTQTTVHGICQALFGFEVLAEAKKKQTDEPSPPAASSSSSTTGGVIPPGSPGTGRVGED